MPVIRISDEVMEILKKFAIPLEDTPDTALRRVLTDYINLISDEIPEDRSEERNQMVIKKKTATDNRLEKYGRFIFLTLESLGGSAKAEIVTSNIEKTFGQEFSSKEREFLDSGTPRWLKNTHWARYEMNRIGLLNKNSPYGVWELTKAGKIHFKK